MYGLERYVTGRTFYRKDERINRVFGDLCDHHAIRQIINSIQPEVVFHLAALSPVAISYEQPTIVNSTNYLATINLAEACMRQVDGFKHFIFAGTSEEYGNQEAFPIRETARFFPNSPYAVSKVAANHYLNFMHDAYDFPVTVCRPFNTYGRVGTTHFVVERIISQILQGSDILYLGDPLPVRDLMFREDHVDAYLTVFGNPEQSIGEAFNFCTGEGFAIMELVSLIIEKTGFKGRVIWNSIPKRPLDIDTLIGDPTKAQQILKWQSKYSLSEGLELTISELRNQNG